MLRYGPKPYALTVKCTAIAVYSTVGSPTWTTGSSSQNCLNPTIGPVQGSANIEKNWTELDHGNHQQKAGQPYRAP